MFLKDSVKYFAFRRPISTFRLFRVTAKPQQWQAVKPERQKILKQAQCQREARLWGLNQGPAPGSAAVLQ